MKKDEILKVIEAKPDADFIIRTKDEEDAYLANHQKQIEEQVIPGKISELHNRYDEDIFSVTGLRKGQTEKTYDFTKRVLAEFKTKAEKADVLANEINSLKQQIKDGTGDKKTLADLEAVQKAYKELETTKDSEITKVKTEFEKYRIKADIQSARSGIALKKNIPESAVNALWEQAVNKLTGMASFQDGKLVFMKDGIVMRNAHNALNPYTAAELLKEELKDVIDTGEKKLGPDVSKEVEKEFDKDGKLTKIALIVPESVRTREDLSKYLVTAGLLRGTEEYMLAYKEYSANLPVR